MFKLLCCVVYVTLIFENAVANPLSSLTVLNCGKSLLPAYYPDRIVGGTPTRLGQHPWMVSLREEFDYRFEHACGASILNENWIVTAAHCIDFPYEPRKYEILAGLHKLSDEYAPTVRKYEISKIIMHPDFDDDTYVGDIALLKTSQPIDISNSNGYINGICLPKTKEDPTGYATVIGWGHTKTDGENSDILRQVVVPIIDRDMCNEAYDEDTEDGIDDVTENMICAGMTGRDSCQNDSGGPLFQTDNNGISTLIGIVSHGAGCGERFFPGVYTKMSMFQKWMTEAMSS
ncbi:hypothetical protein JTE90_028763 [Oedothorax gibbosus]|uniref:Peptidase S1 domain-containing protein n=1 Tax=Oedothorax gibbosus TaxID=931172 RepID=A0AAV6VZF4_9ARAC|nr:hypothetical protein JTE90_028763 [Oedothorax gibbosus]